MIHIGIVLNIFDISTRTQGVLAKHELQQRLKTTPLHSGPAVAQNRDQLNQYLFIIYACICIIFMYSLSEGVKVEVASTKHMTYFQNTKCGEALCTWECRKVIPLFA